MACWKDPTTKDAFVLSWISTLLTLIFCVLGILYYTSTRSSLCLVFGLENMVDFMSSVVVLWRFWASGTLTKEREKILKRRELRASMAISLILILLGMGVIATSSYDINKGAETDSQMETVLVMSATSIGIFCFLTVFKFHYADKLSSESLYKDGVCSLIGTILSVGLLTNTFVIRQHPGLWWLDPLVAMCCGFAALFLGFHSLLVAYRHRRVPILSWSWWMMSRGDARAPSMPYDGDRSSFRNTKKSTPKKQKKAAGSEGGDLELQQSSTEPHNTDETETSQPTKLSEGIV